MNPCDQQPIDRAHPTAILFLLDQSGSMEDPIGGGDGLKKKDAAADAINKVIYNLVLRATKMDGVRDYYDIGVIGYGGKAEFILKDPDSENPEKLMPISEVSDRSKIVRRMKKIPDGAGGYIETEVNFNIWFEPKAYGGTPMTDAFRKAYDVLKPWIDEHLDSQPPIVINITDGQSTDGNPSDAAERVSGLRTNCGHVLIFNCHIPDVGGPKILYPDSENVLDDRLAGSPDLPFAKLLFNISSTLPSKLVSVAREQYPDVTDMSRGFVFNADFADLVNFLDIGTRVELR